MILDKIDPAKVVVVPTRYGRMMVLENDRYMGRAMIRTGEYSESEVALWRQLLRPGMIACDVGANIGAHTVALAQMVGLVFAFEPLPFMYRMMVGNVALNGLPNVIPCHCAVGDTAGTLNVPGFDYTADENYGGIPLGHWDQGNPIPVQRLDDLLPAAHFIKADVEGMEMAVLKGAERIIRECRPILYVEANPEEGHPTTEGPGQVALIRHMQGLGYDCWWHFAPHFNPDNHHGVPPQDDHERTVVSYNILAIPKGKGEINGLPKIPEYPAGGSENLEDTDG